VLLLAFLLRVRLFLTGDFYFLLDQARDLMLVKEIVVNHDLPLIGARSGIGGIFHGPLWLFMLVPTFLLSGGDPYWTLVPVFIVISVLIVLTGIVIGWKLYGVKYGLLFGLLLSISAQLLGYMYNFSNAHVMPLIFLIYLFSIIRYMRGSDYYLVLSVICIGLGIHFEVAFAVFLIPVTIIALIFRAKFPSIKIIGVSLVGFAIMISTYVLFELKSKFLMTQAALKLLSGHGDPIKGYEQYSNIFYRMSDRFALFTDSFYSPLFSSDTLSKILVFVVLSVSVFLVFRGKLQKKATREDTEFIFLLLIPIIIFSLFIFYPQPIWSHYIYAVSISSIMLFALAMKKITQYQVGKFFVVITLIIIAFPAVRSVYGIYIEDKYPSVEALGSYKNQLSVAEWVFGDAGREKYGYLVYTPQILTYNMDYLMWWEGKVKGYSNYSAGKLETTYLIMYPPDKGDRNAHDFWKKNIIKTNGKVLQSKKFNSGIIVQKIRVSDTEPSVDPNYFHGILFR
jgi:hypothetical protein